MLTNLKQHDATTHCRGQRDTALFFADTPALRVGASPVIFNTFLVDCTGKSWYRQQKSARALNAATMRHDNNLNGAGYSSLLTSDAKR